MQACANPPTLPAADSQSIRFIGRQPIFDGQEKVYGYELLYRSGLENHYTAKDSDAAAREVVDNYLTAGTRTLTAGRRAFINCTREFLVSEYATLLPRATVVIEILESVEPDDVVLAACRKLKQLGYVIALDDFVYSEKFQPFVDLADIIKVDFQLSAPRECEQMAEKFGPMGIQMLAEKVETRAQFSQARDTGYVYFQGYFFCKPQIVPSRHIPAFKMHYLRILQAVSKEDLDVDEIVSIINHEVSLCYKLLKLVNSALFGFRCEINSTRHAIALLGANEVKKWAAVAAVLGLAGNEPSELILTSLARARTCELLASKLGSRSQAQNMFLLGVFSLMDALLGRPMREIVSEVALPQMVRAALLGEANRFREVLDLVTFHEAGLWSEVNEIAGRLHQPRTRVCDAYLEGLDWAQRIFRA